MLSDEGSRISTVRPCSAQKDKTLRSQSPTKAGYGLHRRPVRCWTGEARRKAYDGDEWLRITGKCWLVRCGKAAVCLVYYHLQVLALPFHAVEIITKSV